MSEEEKKAIEILNNYLCETHRKFCSIGAVGIPNKEYFAIEEVLNLLTKQEKMIDLMAERIEYDTEWFFSDLDNKKADEIKQYFEKKAEESE